MFVSKQPKTMSNPTSRSNFCSTLHLYSLQRPWILLHLFMYLILHLFINLPHLYFRNYDCSYLNLLLHLHLLVYFLSATRKVICHRILKATILTFEHSDIFEFREVFHVQITVINMFGVSKGIRRLMSVDDADSVAIDT